MTLTFTEESTTVPIANGQSVEINPKQPWPSAYRGSKYSLVNDDDFTSDSPLLKWEHRDLSIFADPPTGLWRTMTLAGKSGGLGSFRVTAGGEVLTKVPADEYEHVDQAPIDEGWIPVYLGKLSGEIEFEEVDHNPDSPSESIAIWRGLPFSHGERWSVSHDDKLIWKWRDYRFESAFDHPDIVAKYNEYRPNPGRLYITEHGDIWINVPHSDITPGKEEEVRRAIDGWKQTAEEGGDAATLRLVNRRLVATSPTEDPTDGQLPIHIGHLNQFDDGLVPRPIADDETYFVAVAAYESVWE